MLFPLAAWVGPIPNRTPAGMGHVQGLVLHVEQGTEAGTDSWFHNPGAEASAHFGNPKAGGLQQFVDTDDKAWAEVAGNSDWISVEHEGFSGQTLTASQLENDAQLLAWLHQAYGVPLVPTNNPAGEGLGWHGMGGAAWGDHLACPGTPIVNARPAICARAAQILAPTPPAPVLEDDDMNQLIYANATGHPHIGIIGGHTLVGIDPVTEAALKASPHTIVLTIAVDDHNKIIADAQ